LWLWSISLPLLTLSCFRQLLLDCGIGTPKEETDGGVAPHRVLIFCQLKQMLDLIENDLFKPHLPTLTYMRLDGTTPSAKRHGVVQTFNADPSIDVLLMTTQVGGLGLNLTGADTVIFVEHDWNPMRDLQAMDRAHRLGQKRVVNVYRLITRGTLEEKIMGYVWLFSFLRLLSQPECKEIKTHADQRHPAYSLQRFKLNIASSVVTQQNSELSTMDTDQILDLFTVSSGQDDEAEAKKKAKETGGPVSQRNLLEGLEDLPAEGEYADLDAAKFAASLSK
jgi:TATA-binding protein-associated factor